MFRPEAKGSVLYNVLSVFPLELRMRNSLPDRCTRELGLPFYIDFLKYFQSFMLQDQVVHLCRNKRLHQLVVFEQTHSCEFRLPLSLFPFR